jgi:hypothetical protein
MDGRHEGGYDDWGVEQNTSTFLRVSVALCESSYTPLRTI